MDASVVSEGDKIHIGMPLPMIPYEIVPIEKETLDVLQQSLKVNQDVEVSVRLATSPAALFESGESALKLLLEGLEVEVRLNLWRKVSTVLMKVIEQGELDASLLPLFGALAPAFLLKIKGDLQIEVDENMKETVFANPLVEPLLMDALTLIHAIGGCNSDEPEEFEQHLNEHVPPPIAALVRALDGKVGDEITYSVVQPRLGVTGRINGNGLGLLLRHGIKMMK